MMVPDLIITKTIIAYVLLVCKCKSSNEIKACQNRYMALGSDKNMAKICDVTIGATVQLYCNFCSDKLNLQAAVWYYKQRGSNNSVVEVIKGIDTNNKKIALKDANILELRSFDRNESGIYSCRSLFKREDYTFTYVLDGIYNVHLVSYTGTKNLWQEYKRIKIDPVNEMFEKSQKEPFKSFRETLRFSFRLKTSWENWGPCEAHNHTTGVRRRLGKCRLHPVLNKNKRETHSNDYFVDNVNALYLIDNYDVSCHSIKLNETLPEISKIVRYIPEYEAMESCNLSTRAVDIRRFEKDISYEYKYSITKQIAENSHFTLICPEIIPDSNLEWYKDGTLLGSSYKNNMAETEEEPRLTIDLSNSLYILHATKSEEGIYTCTVNNIKIQKFDIKVVAKSKLLNDEFIRYSIYLGFVLSLTMTCYCTGICVAWNRRTSFADPLNLYVKQAHKSESFY